MSTMSLRRTRTRAAVGAASLAAATLLVPAGQASAYPVIPLVSYISPHYGPTTGGTHVTVHGGGLQHVLKVTFGGVAGTHLDVSGTRITVNSPPHAAGRTYVRIVWRNQYGNLQSSHATPDTRFGYRA